MLFLRLTLVAIIFLINLPNQRSPKYTKHGLGATIIISLKPKKIYYT